MIIGMGSDLINIARIEKVLARHGQRFIDRCFTAEEIAKAERRRGAGLHVATYAKRFAAKEACAKALGSGIAQGILFREIGVVNDVRGRPTLALTGTAAARLAALVPEGKTAVIHLTLTDEPPLALAQVVIEAV